MPAEHKSQLLIAVLGFASVVVTTVSSNWDKWFPRPGPPPVVTSTPIVTASPPETAITTPPETITPPASAPPRVVPSPRVTPLPPYTPSPRVTVTPPDPRTPPATTTPSASSSPRVTSTPPATTPSALILPSAFTTASATTSITSPRQGATVGQRIAVEGVLTGLRPEQHVFLCVKSQAFGRLIYPQGKVIPDATGQWTVESIYATPGYRYETFLVVTTNTEAAAMLNDPQARKYGLRELPPGTERLGTAIVVTRE
jgi:hypothetical protein